MLDKKNMHILDKYLIWKIENEDGKFVELQNTYDLMSSMNDFIKGDESNYYQNIRTMVAELIYTAKPQMALDILAKEIERINLSQQLGINISFSKKHLAYGNSPDKKRLVVKFLLQE